MSNLLKKMKKTLQKLHIYIKNNAKLIEYTFQREAYSELSTTCKMELFAKGVNDAKPKTILGKSSILDI